jgi:hypothetical protein
VPGVIRAEWDPNALSVKGALEALLCAMEKYGIYNFNGICRCNRRFESVPGALLSKLLNLIEATN